MGSLKKPLSRVSSDTSTTNKTFVQRGTIDLRGPYRTSQTNRTDRTDRTNERFFGFGLSELSDSSDKLPCDILFLCQS